MYMPTPGGLTGAPRRMLTLARELQNQGVSVVVASDAGSEVLTAAAQLQGVESLELDPVGGLKARGADVFRRGGVFRIWLLLLLVFQNLRLFLVVRKVGADAVWLRGSKGILFAGVGSFLARKPVVWDVDYELPSEGLVRHLHRLGLRLSSEVVCQYARAPEQIFGTGLASQFRNKLQSIIPGIDLDRLEYSALKKRTEQFEHQRKLVILQVGTVCDRKNQRYMVDVLAALKKSLPDVTFDWQIVGGLADETYVDCLRKATVEAGISGSTRLLGWRDDISELMAEADYLVMPSKDEGVPNTVQEAMYLGLPVVVSEAGGMPEIVSHGKTGWVAALEAPEEWARIIAESFQDKETRDGVSRAANVYARKNFGTEVWGKRYCRALPDVRSWSNR